MAELKRVILRSRPFLYDKVIQDMQQTMADALPWLDHIFGRAERLVKKIDGIRQYTPNVYLGKGEYLPVTPDSRLGNYSFFQIDEPEQVEWNYGNYTHFRSPFSLIVWVDMRTIEGIDERNTEEVKDMILRALKRQSWIKHGGMKFDRIYNRAENVFQGYTLDEVDNQFLMSPYCGWRFTGELWIDGECLNGANYLYVKPEEVQWITDMVSYDVFSDGEWIIK